MKGNEQEPRQNDTKTIYHDDYTCRLKIQTTETWIQAFPHCLLHLTPGSHHATVLLRLGPQNLSDINGIIVVVLECLVHFTKYNVLQVHLYYCKWQGFLY